MDNIQALQQLNSAVLDSDIHLFEQPVATIWENVSRGGQRGHFWYGGENPDIIRPVSSIPRARFEVDVPIYYFVGTGDSIEVKIEIKGVKDTANQLIKTGPGLHKFIWNREYDVDPYTSEDKVLLENAFLKLDTARSRIRNEVERFRNAGDSIVVQRRIVTGLINLLDVDPALGIQKAEPGNYQVSISYGDRKKTKSLIIREDPILKEE